MSLPIGAVFEDDILGSSPDSDQRRGEVRFTDEAAALELWLSMVLVLDCNNGDQVLHTICIFPLTLQGG